jgi:hypothetical protein
MSFGAAGFSQRLQPAADFFSQPAEYLHRSPVGQPILAAACFQPASSMPDEFLERRCGALEVHKAKESLRLGLLVGPSSKSRLKGGCTVESLVLAGKPHVGQDGILLPIGNRPLRVFIPFHGPKAHADRHDCLPHWFLGHMR